MRKRFARNDWLLLLLGMFSRTQVTLIGSIGISEIFIYLLAPFFFIKDYGQLRKDGFLPIIWLAIMAVLGCVVASVHNHIIPAAAIRGVAMVYSLFAYPIILHRLLRNNLRGMRWILVGICISMIINVFAFRQGYEVAMQSGGYEDAETTERIISGPLFWLQRLGGWLMALVHGWYLSMPMLYLCVAPLIMCAFTLITSDSGRSATLSMLGGVFLILLGRKRLHSMRFIQKYLLFVVLGGIVMAFSAKTGYAYLGRNGLLNEKAQRKYDGQMKQGTGALQMLMGGRSETFAGLFACLDNPFWGFGPWSKDENGYIMNFLAKYGDPDDYERHAMSVQKAAAMGYVPAMPCHSHIIGFWLRYGILGLPFWLYVAYMMYRHLKHNTTAIPQWYGYFSIMIAANAWHIVFSPYGGRIEDNLFITCLLFAEAVRRGKIQLSPDMYEEIARHNNGRIR